MLETSTWGQPKMPRPMKLRQVAMTPAVTFFKPAGVPMSALDVVTLALEEVEAIRLKDIENLHQEQCAERMGVSRATFHHVLGAARAKLADAILNGKAIQVEGGAFAFPGGRFRCRRDGSEWELPPGPLPGISSVSCPRCKSRDVHPVFPPHGPWFGRHGHGRCMRGWEGRWGAPGHGRGPARRDLVGGVDRDREEGDEESRP